jgi:transposase-like protein
MEVTKKKEREEQGQEGKKPGIDPAIIEELMKDYQRPEDLTGPGGILEELHKRLYERVLGAEQTHYLGYAKGEAPSAVYPDCEIQTCIVHLIRNSLSFCNWKERKTSGH